MKTHFIHINPMHLIVGAGAALGATAAGLSATMLPHASGHWIEPAAMLGLIGGVFGYLGFDLIARLSCAAAWCAQNPAHPAAHACRAAGSSVADLE